MPSEAGTCTLFPKKPSLAFILEELTVALAPRPLGHSHGETTRVTMQFVTADMQLGVPAPPPVHL